MDSTASSPFVAAAERIADDVLFPDAQVRDRLELLRRDHFDPLADAGLFGIAGPAELGFADLGASDSRRLFAAVGGGCGATFFCWAQHHGVVRTIRSGENDAIRDEWLEPLCRGDRIAGVAFAHLRRQGRRAITATRVPGGWRLDGAAPWATSWGIADAFAIAAESDDGRVVWSLLRTDRPVDGMTPRPLDLPVFSSTGTVALEFDGCVVPDHDTIHTETADGWRATDRRRAALGQPAVLGVADRAIRLLAAHVRDDADPAAETTERLGADLAATWRRDDALLASVADGPSVDDLDDESVIEEMSDHRASCIDLAQRSSTALLAAVGGAGMDLSHPAQRLAREAAFYVIQAQTVDGRAATLRAATSRQGGSAPG